jgi:hypothetical protein
MPLHYIPNSPFFNLIFGLIHRPIDPPVLFPVGLRSSKFILWVTLNSLYNEKMETADQWVKVGTVENRFEGDRISQALEEAGIQFFIKSFLDTAYNGLYIPQKGWGVVMVSEKNREEAERLISEIKKTFAKEENDETGQSG